MHTDHPFTEKQDVFQLPDFAAGPYSVICDFDGTVTPFDVTDAILERFARPAWKTIEDEWVRGAISARQCMERQIPLIEAPLERLDAFLDTVPVTGGFVEFVRYSRSKGIPLGIVQARVGIAEVDGGIPHLEVEIGLVLVIVQERAVTAREQLRRFQIVHGVAVGAIPGFGFEKRLFVCFRGLQDILHRLGVKCERGRRSWGREGCRFKQSPSKWDLFQRQSSPP